MFIKELIERIRFWKKADRIGPDIPLTYWRFFFKAKMLKFCKRKFFFFSDNAEIRPGVYVVSCSKISIGSRVVLRPGTMLFGDGKDLEIAIKIEDDVLIGSGVHIYTENHAFTNPDLPIIDQGHSLSAKVEIKRGAWIGANAIILPGVIIGENTVVGAGSVVTKPLPNNIVAAGVPAKMIKAIVS